MLFCRCERKHLSTKLTCCGRGASLRPCQDFASKGPFLGEACQKTQDLDKSRHMMNQSVNTWVTPNKY